MVARLFSCICYDYTQHCSKFHCLQVVAEIEEPFLPLPDDLVVNLHESRAVVEALLDSLPQMFASNMVVRFPTPS